MTIKALTENDDVYILTIYRWMSIVVRFKILCDSMKLSPTFFIGYITSKFIPYKNF